MCACVFVCRHVCDPETQAIHAIMLVECSSKGTCRRQGLLAWQTGSFLLRHTTSSTWLFTWICIYIYVRECVYVSSLTASTILIVRNICDIPVWFFAHVFEQILAACNKNSQLPTRSDIKRTMPGPHRLLWVVLKRQGLQHTPEAMSLPKQSFSASKRKRCGAFSSFFYVFFCPSECLIPSPVHLKHPRETMVDVLDV